MNLKTIYSLYLKPRALIILVSSVLTTAIITLLICRMISHRYAMTAMIKVAEFGSVTAAGPFSAFTGKTQSSIGTEAMGYLEFQYLSRSRNADGVRMVEVKEVKTSESLLFVAEGPTMEAIQSFLSRVLLDLQTKYKPSIDSAMARGTQEVKFLNREIASLETLKNQVEDGIQNIGPAPALVSQMMEINQNLIKLKQEYFFKNSLISDEKVHNFKLDTELQVAEGAPIWPKTKQAVSFSIVLSFVLSAYGIFLFEYIRKRLRAKRIFKVRWKVANSPAKLNSVSNIDILRNQ